MWGRVKSSLFSESAHFINHRLKLVISGKEMCPPYVSVTTTKCYQNMLFCAQFYKLFHKVLLVYLRIKSTKIEGFWLWENFYQYMH